MIFAIIIIILILIFEIYQIFEPEYNIPTKQIENNTKLIQDLEVKFEKFVTNEMKNIEFKPGKIMIKNDYTIFIDYNKDVIPMEKDKIYNIDEDFNIEIINLEGENIEYYYIANN